MNKLIFGSVALKHWFPQYHKNPNDLDYISKELPSERKRGIEYHWNPAFQYILDNNSHNTYVDPDFLYTIKCSHACYNIFWDKTMAHIVFMKENGCKIDINLYKLLRKDWLKIHGAKNFSLKMKNDEFFTKAVDRKFNHDWLHEFVAFGDRPMHEMIRKDLSSPLCSYELWSNLDRQSQIKAALEEIYVIAIERFVLSGKPPKYSKYRAIKNLILTMTKGWFNRFLIDNFKELMYNDHDEHYIKKVEEILRYEEENSDG